MRAEDILNNCDLLIHSNCIIHNDKVYECIADSNLEHKYRVFIALDDYDYVEDQVLIAELDALFSAR